MGLAAAGGLYRHPGPICVNLADLTVISSFASSTILLIFSGVTLAALRLHGRIGIHPAGPSCALVLSLGSWLVPCGYL